jgi:glycosyltransferase involved in cell wall biosynthesis
MLLGKPTIGTDYSGNTDFLTAATGYPVPYELVPVGAGEYPDHGGQVWAEPDVAAAARAMASIVDDPAAAEARAATGQAFIKTHHSLAAVGRQMRDRLVTLGLL